MTGYGLRQGESRTCGLSLELRLIAKTWSELESVMVSYTKKRVQQVLGCSGDIAVTGQVLRPSASIAKSLVQRNKRRQRDTEVRLLQISRTQPARLVIIYTEVDACT